LASLLIIGGTGFFGNSIIKYLTNNKHHFSKIIILSRKKIKKNIYLEKLKKKIKINKINSNILNVTKLPKADYVIYAAILSNYKEDYIAVKNFSKLAFKYYRNSKILYTSSGAIYGKQPHKLKGFKENYLKFNKKLNFAKGYKQQYSKYKLKNEEIFKQLAKKGIKVSIVRCFSFVGEFLTLNSHYLIGNFIKNILNKEKITVSSNYKVMRSFMLDDELVRWLLKILDFSNKNCPIYNVGSNNAIEIRSLAKLLSKKYNLLTNFSKKKFNNKITDRYVPDISKAKKDLKLINNFSSFNSIVKTINCLKK
jgi:dTDP-glucose 4,6-dehydratase